MKNKRRLKAIILAALAAVGTLLLSSCSKKEIMFTGRTKTFEPGTHMVVTYSEIKNDPTNDLVPYYPGYKAISIGITPNARWAIMYENTETVEVAETDKGYNHIGSPVNEIVLKIKDNQ